MADNQQNIESQIDNNECYLSYKACLDNYSLAFVNANEALQQKKLEGVKIDSDIISDLYFNAFIAREELFNAIHGASPDVKKQISDDILSKYKESTWVCKRSYVDVRAFLINQSIC